MSSHRQLLDSLSKNIRFSEAWVISTMPRGGLQMVQPSHVDEAWLKPYVREFHAHDAGSWKAMITRRAIRSDEAFDGGLERSHYYRGFLEPNRMRYMAVAPLTAPVLDGYGGAIHLYRGADQGEFTDADLRALTDAARQFDRAGAEARAGRLHEDCLRHRPWPRRPAVRQWAMDASLKSLLDENLDGLDERVSYQLQQDAKQRIGVLSEPVAVDRLAVPDSVNLLWTFHVSAYQNYPALGNGVVVFYSLEPDHCDWRVLRGADVAADTEVARLVPAMHFMQEHFHRGPTLKEIARTVHLSPFHFHRRFTELLGITPKHFLLQCQIFRAKKLLLNGEMDLAEIASGCGFAHQSHFTSRFRQATGLTPTRWRKQAVKMLEATPA